jgi:photosystem II stability/assembly factor-like uncharacterized protein
MHPMIYVGTIGEGLWQSDDLGRTWSPEPGVPGDARIYALAVSPDGRRLYAGAEGSVYRRDGVDWSHLPLPDAGLQVWALGIHPREPSLLLAGCRPLALLASEDDGKHWTPLDLSLPAGTPEPHTPRVTTVLFDPDRPGAIWAGVEVGGVFTTSDLGRIWSALNEHLPSLDIHALVLAGDRTLLTATPRGVAGYRGGHWVLSTSESPDRYFRALVQKPGNGSTLYAGLGNGPPGTRGTVLVSTDNGQSWSETGFPGAGSSVWALATDPHEPELLVAAAIKGEIFTSLDSGQSWARASRKFVEVRAVACAA